MVPRNWELELPRKLLTVPNVNFWSVPPNFPHGIRFFDALNALSS